jgi:hypothetical protein
VQPGRPEAHELLIAPGRHEPPLLDREDLEQADAQEVVDPIRVTDERPALEQGQAKEQGGESDEREENDEIGASEKTRRDRRPDPQGTTVSTRSKTRIRPCLGPGAYQAGYSYMLG